MVNGGGKAASTGLSSKAKILLILRSEAGNPVSGSKLALEMGVSRVAVWKGIQSLMSAGYQIYTMDSGYAIDIRKSNDFLYPWEFSEKEPLFRLFEETDSTMDRMREIAKQGLDNGAVVIAEKQNAGKGRYGKNWLSSLGGLYFTVLERPPAPTAIADYSLPVMLYQVAIARVLSSLLKKPAKLRWPNDVYIDRRKIAGVLTEIAVEGDSISWMAIGIGINVNNPVLLGKAANCAEIAGHPLSRREILLSIIDEVQQVRAMISSGMAYTQGNRLLADEWNAHADCIGAKVVIADAVNADEHKRRVFAGGIFAGIDPAGRCIIKHEDGKGTLHFNQGPVSMLITNNEQ